MKLNGKIAVVTGASKGIGKAIATRLAHDGATVAINYHRDAAPADALVAELNNKGFTTRAFRAGVSKPAECSLMPQKFHARTKEVLPPTAPRFIIVFAQTFPTINLTKQTYAISRYFHAQKQI